MAHRTAGDAWRRLTNWRADRAEAARRSHMQGPVNKPSGIARPAGGPDLSATLLSAACAGREQLASRRLACCTCAAPAECAAQVVPAAICLIKTYPCLSCSPHPTGKMGRMSLAVSFGSYAKKFLMFLKIITTPKPSLEYSTHIQIFIT